MLLQRVATGDATAVDALLTLHRPKLKKMVRVRLSVRLQGRVDDSDIVQEAFAEVVRRLPEYLKGPKAPFFLWLRQITAQKLIDVHRHHLGAQARDARLEISLHRGRLPMASSVSLAAQLLGRLPSPSHNAVRAEMRLLMQEALGQMGDLDREILSMRHYEELTNQEVAEELGLDKSAASQRYLRALKRLHSLLKELGVLD